MQSFKNQTSDTSATPTKLLWLKKYTQNIFFMAAVFLVLALLIEIFGFNFRAWESLTYTTVDENTYTIATSPDASLTQNDILPDKFMLSFPENGDCYIEICGLQDVISNIYLNATTVNTDDTSVSVTISAIDDGNALYYDLPSSLIKDDNTATHYIRLNLSGQTYRLKINFDDANGKIFYLDNIQMNVHRPFCISVKRTLMLFFVFMALYIFRPGSALYAIAFSPKAASQRIILILLACIELISIFKIATYNDNYIDPPWKHHYQYALLAEAITEGHFYLDETPSDALQAMDNPYDKNLRNENNVKYLWDVAYYDGHYYVYFGIVPVLMFYLPYYLLTGSYFPTWWGIIITMTAITIGLMFLLHALIKKYFHHVSLAMFILMDLLMLCGCGIFVIATNATFYQLPIAMGVAFTIWGLYLWISSEGKHLLQLIAGSLCMALVAGCRPQLLLGSFLAMPLFLPDWLSVFKKKQYSYVVSRVIFALIPFIIVAVFLMYYNATRFGSPFDFGANYNLTTNDMTHRGFHLDRLWLGTYMYVLHPPCFTTAFPFVRYVPSDIHYQGKTILEHMYGGILWLNPLMFSMCLYFKKHQQLKAHKLTSMVWMCIAFGLIIVAADTQMAGILFRYLCDFGIFFSIASVLILLSITDNAANIHMKINTMTTDIHAQVNTVIYSDGSVQSCITPALLHWQKIIYAGSFVGLALWYLTVEFIIK